MCVYVYTFCTTMASRYIFVVFLLPVIILPKCIEVSSCATNCQCTRTTIECYIENCDDLLEYGSDTLIIHGELCVNHVEELQGLNKGTFVILMDNVCDSIPDCESVKDSVTDESTTHTHHQPQQQQK